MKRIVLALLMFCYSFAFAGPSYNSDTASNSSYQDGGPEFITLLLPPRSPFKLLAMIGAVALIGCGVVTLRENSYASGVVSGATAVVVGCTYVCLISVNW
jgi:hypothetical protein